MRNKFTELVDAGVASFKHEPIAQDKPHYCPVCHTYNNVWGVITDTHMSCLPDGRRVITGTFVSDCPKWTQLMYASFWGGVRFDTTGYMSLSEFLYKSGLETRSIVLNGQNAIELVPCEECAVADLRCVAYTTTETKFPQPVNRLGGVLECLELCGSLSEAANRLNVSIKVPGDHWHVHEGKIVGQAYGQNVILEVSFDKGTKVENAELAKLFDAEGIGELFYRQFPRYFALDSDDKKWQAVLRKNDHNKIFARSFDELTPQQWFEEAQAIIATIS